MDVGSASKTRDRQVITRADPATRWARVSLGTAKAFYARLGNSAWLKLQSLGQSTAIAAFLFLIERIEDWESFVNDTRAQRRKGLLSAERIAKLDELGFRWDGAKRR